MQYLRQQLTKELAFSFWKASMAITMYWDLGNSLNVHPVADEVQICFIFFLVIIVGERVFNFRERLVCSLSSDAVYDCMECA